MEGLDPKLVKPHNQMMARSWLVAAATLFVFISAMAQIPDPQKSTTGGSGTQLRDDLLDKLVGKWKLTRRMGKRVEHNRVTVEWVLNHNFLQIQMKDVKRPPKYEAKVMIGSGPTDKQYVIYWLDTFGGKYSEKGYGTREGSSIKFVFPYPDGPVHNTFTWNPDSKSWRSLIEQPDAHGAWSVFADDTLQR